MAKAQIRFDLGFHRHWSLLVVGQGLCSRGKPIIIKPHVPSHSCFKSPMHQSISRPTAQY